DSEWDDRGIDGVYRFLNRFYNLVMENKDKTVEPTQEMIKLRHRFVHDITTRLENFSLNTVVSGFMEYNNKMIDLVKKTGGIDRDTLETAIILLAPFAPHVSEELWAQMGHDTSVFKNTWPTYDEEMLKDSEIEIAVQINGKTRGTVMIPADASKETAINKAKEVLAGKISGTIIKEIYVPGKIVNIVIK
ncbi:MAG TPA: class I tRNA ligase family protein, partial [Mobilitalea sp.]|nr:class I tRNA ligase family protein [Mobilitalea sp.]